MPPEDDHFRLVASRDAEAPALRRAAYAIPDEVLATGPGELFPDAPHRGECRICGRVADLTEEHLPPRGAFNKGQSREVALDDVLGVEDLDPPGDGPALQGGIRGHTLCDGCNHPRYAREYQEWAHRAAETIATVRATIEVIDDTDGYQYAPVEFRDVYPGRFVRQVISMMLTVSGNAELARQYPDLVDLVLGGPARPLPPPLRLYLNLYAHNVTRICGGPAGQGYYSGDDQEWRWLLEVSFAPLSTVMLIKGRPDHGLGIDISELTEWEVDRKGDIRFDDPGVLIGFGHKPFPGDFRTRGQLLAMRIDPDG